MPTEKRRFEPAVIERLFREPYRFEYFQAVRMLELWLKRHGRPQHDAIAHYVRFQNSTSLGFPASQLEAIQPEPRDIERGAHALGKALQDASLSYIRVTPSFMGLLSGTGVLPARAPCWTRFRTVRWPCSTRPGASTGCTSSTSSTARIRSCRCCWHWPGSATTRCAGAWRTTGTAPCWTKRSATSPPRSASAHPRPCRWDA
jgi:hypothetical protein